MSLSSSLCALDHALPLVMFCLLRKDDTYLIVDAHDFGDISLAHLRKKNAKTLGRHMKQAAFLMYTLHKTNSRLAENYATPKKDASSHSRLTYDTIF